MSIWFKYFEIKILDISKYLNSHIWLGGHRGCDRMVVGFTTTDAIIAYVLQMMVACLIDLFPFQRTLIIGYKV
jgi:hypothetical protein